MQTFDVLDPKLNVFGCHFLEASAGTGKTFAIENIVPRLLLESETPLALGEILVVTFTKAATRELKVRIYKNLVAISGALDTKEEGPRYLENIRRQGKEAILIAKRRIEEALFSFEQAQVFTLHSFCLHVLQEFAFEANFFSYSLSAKEENLEREITERMKDFFRSEFTSDFLTPAQMKKVCQYKRIYKDMDKLCFVLCQSLLSLLGKGHTISTAPCARDRLQIWNSHLKTFSHLSKAELWKELSLASPRLAKSKKWQGQIERFFSFLEKGFLSMEEFDEFLQDKELFLSQVREAPLKNVELLSHPGLFEKMRQIFVPLHEEATDPKALFLQLLYACQGHYKKGKADLSYYTPDDFVQHLRKAVEEKSFCEKVQEKYKAVIIDEFQDTDADQWKIIHELFYKDNTHRKILYLVGDPKQSIYGFRSADVYVYLQAKKLFDESSHFCLGTNFRSHPDLVHALNGLFSVNLPSCWMSLPVTQESLLVRKVEAKPLYESGLTQESLGRVHFFLGEEESVLISYMAKESIRLKQEKNFLFHQMVVLVKDRFQADRVQKAFALHGLSCQMQKNLEENDLCFECVKDLVKTLISPYDLSCLKKLLGGVLFGYTRSDLRGGLDNLLLYRTCEYFSKQGLLFRKKGFGAFFSNFLAMESKEPGKTVAEELLARENASLYFDIRQLFQIVLKHLTKNLYDPEDLLSAIEDLQRKANPEFLKRFSEEVEDQIQVMTLHKSKGLEFDIVFALALSARHTGKEEFISVRTKNERRVIVPQKEDDAFFAHLDEVDAEKLRQLYVALTRAKERVYIPFIIPSFQGELQRGSASPLELFLGGWGQSKYSFQEAYARIASLSLDSFTSFLEPLQKNFQATYELLPKDFCFTLRLDDKQVPLVPPACKDFAFSEGFILSFSSVSSAKKHEFLDTLEVYALPVGAETGVVIHAILEELCKADLHRKQDFCFSPLIAKFCKGSCLEGKESLVQEMIQKAIRMPIETSLGTFTIQDVSASNMQMEMEFCYPVGNSLMKGFMDMVFCFQGKYFLLDWKTNALGLCEEDYLPEKIWICIQENHYDLQASIYAKALQKYFALFDSRPFDQCFGGAIYFFLRGGKPFFFQPDLQLIDCLDLGEPLCSEE